MTWATRLGEQLSAMGAPSRFRHQETKKDTVFLYVFLFYILYCFVFDDRKIRNDLLIPGTQLKVMISSGFLWKPTQEHRHPQETIVFDMVV